MIESRLYDCRYYELQRGGFELRVPILKLQLQGNNLPDLVLKMRNLIESSYNTFNAPGSQPINPKEGHFPISVQLKDETVMRSIRIPTTLLQQIKDLDINMSKVCIRALKLKVNRVLNEREKEDDE